MELCHRKKYLLILHSIRSRLYYNSQQEKKHVWTLKVHVALQYNVVLYQKECIWQFNVERPYNRSHFISVCCKLFIFLFSFFFSSSARKSGYKVLPSQELVALGMTALHVVRSICINAIIVQSIGIDGCLDK